MKWVAESLPHGKQVTHRSFLVKTMAADGLAKQRIRASAAMVLVLFCLLEYSIFRQKRNKKDWYLNLQRLCLIYSQLKQLNTLRKHFFNKSVSNIKIQCLCICVSVYGFNWWKIINSGAWDLSCNKPWSSFNSSWLCNSMPHEKPWPALVQIMAWCIFGTKPLPELMLTYHQ